MSLLERWLIQDVVDAEGPVVKFRDLHYLHFPIYTVAPLKLFYVVNSIYYW